MIPHPAPRLACCAILLLLIPSPPGAQHWIDEYREPARRLIEESLSSGFAWERLAELTDTFGHRLSGSASLDAAIRWAAEQMKRDGL